MRHSKRSLESYLLIDNRAGASVPRFDGSAPIPAGATVEQVIVTCSHCHRQIMLDMTREGERGYCPKCDHYVCNPCERIRVKTGECLPLNALMDKLQNEAVKRLGQDEPSIVLTDRQA